MRRLSWKETRDELCNLIKFVSDLHGGDDIEWLREYAKDVVEAYKDDLYKAIDCFKSLTQGKDYKSHGKPKNDFKSNHCPDCSYVPPFCYYQRDGNCSNRNHINKDVLCGTDTSPS